MCPNHDVVMFHPWKVNPPYLVSVVNCYVDNPLFLTFSALLRPLPDFPLGGSYLTPTCPLFRILPLWSHTGSFVHLGFTCLPPSIPIYIAPCPIFWFLYVPVSSYGLATPPISPTPLPWRRKNLFLLSTQIIYGRRFSPPRLLAPPYPLVIFLSVTNLQYMTQSHPLPLCCLPTDNISS